MSGNQANINIHAGHYDPTLKQTVTFKICNTRKNILLTQMKK